jgi:hypothetical protein
MLTQFSSRESILQGIEYAGIACAFQAVNLNNPAMSDSLRNVKKASASGLTLWI